MKLGSTAALSLALAAGVSGFVPSLDRHAAIGGHRGTRTSSSDGGQLSVAAAPVDEAATTASSSDDQQIEITDVNSVKALSFRQLQKACVARGLPAVGNTAALRSRLLESAGLPDVSAPSAPASAVNGSDEEVSRFERRRRRCRSLRPTDETHECKTDGDPHLENILHWDRCAHEKFKQKRSQQRSLPNTHAS